ncbi:tRNA dihydrouridine synthase [Ideonella livida]|uniref:tRNA-dihydrouridine(16) synthase n=1 Tax=Ideonella livida TaxID=2707176 RepID=A0A7C9TIW3_9BURK|nr:tRNA-dihydrouridine synthase family protein [Ideonella livida]NDY91639.1 tRNA-dihydrouridine synthase family protein [Ideonella livida]
MRLLLAPMEGLLDHTLRDVLTRAGGIDRCVSEFIRVTGTLLPERVFLRIVPELRHGGCTPAGVPVRPQLMGSDPACLADNAARVAALRAPGVDLNFGCPAKVVNRHGGGAALLDDPELLWRIVREVRSAVPTGFAVSAKMRLGTRDDSRAEDCARALAEGGAQELVVHARTREQGYRPPAWWHRIADVRAAVAIPVVANGEIWTAQDARAAREASGCEDLMLGRGMVADPGLAHQIRQALQVSLTPQDMGGAAPLAQGLDWSGLQPLLLQFWLNVCAHVTPPQRAGRMKQWLFYLRRRHPQAQEAYDTLRTVTDSRELARRLLGSAAWPMESP